MRSKEREAEKKKESEKKEKSTTRNILGTIAYIIGVCVFVFLIFTDFFNLEVPSA